jgi:hypothetical protein
MTVAAVWIEDKLDASALCLASDSRLSPGPVDGISKVALFARPDIAGVWAGDFAWASLILNKLDGLFGSSENMVTRQIDVRIAFLRATGVLRTQIPASVSESPTLFHNEHLQHPVSETSVVAGGFSILYQRFFVLKIQTMSESAKWKITMRPLQHSDLIVIGDIPERQATRKAAKRMRSNRQYRGVGRPGWHMEPLKALSDQCAEGGSRSVGGDLQFAKVYRHGATLTFATTVPDFPELVSVRGTRLDRKASKEQIQKKLVIDQSGWDHEDCYFH